jgi:hypothetical protein
MKRTKRKSSATEQAPVTETIPMPTDGRRDLNRPTSSEGRLQQAVTRQERLGQLHAAMSEKQRLVPPPAHEAHNWVKGVLDVDYENGTTTHGRPIWSPKAESEAWERLRFPGSFPDAE